MDCKQITSTAGTAGRNATSGSWMRRVCTEHRNGGTTPPCARRHSNLKYPHLTQYCYTSLSTSNIQLERHPKRDLLRVAIPQEVPLWDIKSLNFYVQVPTP